MISELYQLLGSATKPLFVRAWDKWQMGLELYEAQLTHLYQLNHSSARHYKKQMIKFYHAGTECRLLWPISIPLHLTYAGEAVVKKGTLLHLWWECPVIAPFWKDIKAQIQDILGLDIPLSQYIFSSMSLLCRLLGIRKARCPIFWMRRGASFQSNGSMHKFPIREGWIRGVSRIRDAEDWIATCKGTQFTSIWAVCLDRVLDQD